VYYGEAGKVLSQAFGGLAREDWGGSDVAVASPGNRTNEFFNRSTQKQQKAEFESQI
jgi:hypothetical protein